MVADMTPEQLEEVPGIGPKTVEKISIAVNNYFASLDAAEAVPAEGEVLAEGEAPAEGEVLAEGEVPAEGVALARDDEEGGEAIGQDVPAEEEARELEQEEAAEDDADAGEAADESDVEPGDEGGQSGDEEGLSDVPETDSESVEELADEGQAFEAEVVDGVENAPLADEGERIIHERPETPNENVPDEEEPGEKR